MKVILEYGIGEETPDPTVEIVAALESLMSHQAFHGLWIEGKVQALKYMKGVLERKPDPAEEGNF